MTPEMLADQDQALTVVCPESRCNALYGELCVNLGTQAPLRHLAAHLSRLKAAGVFHAPLDSCDLQRGA